MIINKFENKLYLKTISNEYWIYDTENKTINRISEPVNNIELFDTMFSILYRNEILDTFKEMGIEFRNSDFYDTVCDILFSYNEDSSEYKLLHRFIFLASELDLP